MNELLIKGKKYISSKRASEMTGYAKDYVGQLVRMGKLPAERVGRSWYVGEAEILEHAGKTPAFGDGPISDFVTKERGKLIPTIGHRDFFLPETWGSITYHRDSSEMFPTIKKNIENNGHSGSFNEATNDQMHAIQVRKAMIHSGATQAPQNTATVDIRPLRTGLIDENRRAGRHATHRSFTSRRKPSIGRFVLIFGLSTSVLAVSLFGLFIPRSIQIGEVQNGATVYTSTYAKDLLVHTIKLLPKYKLSK